MERRRDDPAPTAARSEDNRMKRLPHHVTVIFDGSCNFCTWSVELIERFDHDHRVRTVPFQAPGVLDRYGLTQADAEAAAWAITPAGNRYRGAAAVNLALSVALDTRWPIWIYTLPLVRQAEDAIYDLIARNRDRFRGVTPYCQRHPQACT
jgi:predicted DCC family thiol-disulfide oxidoreductase YuxK